MLRLYYDVSRSLAALREAFPWPPIIQMSASIFALDSRANLHRQISSDVQRLAMAERGRPTLYDELALTCLPAIYALLRHSSSSEQTVCQVQ